MCSGTLDGDSFDTSYNWYTFTVDNEMLTASTEYSIVVRAVAGDSSNYILWAKDSVVH